ncbi:hypothetical protein [Sorangium sp. So ce1335]|uniref:hypothetical protein n=1 Tax=Sorangium sp. So ce1335 TaxID=3133335 RepID=UPI003F5F237D
MQGQRARSLNVRLAAIRQEAAEAPEVRPAKMRTESLFLTPVEEVVTVHPHTRILQEVREGMGNHLRPERANLVAKASTARMLTQLFDRQIATISVRSTRPATRE